MVYSSNHCNIFMPLRCTWVPQNISYIWHARSLHPCARRSKRNSSSDFCHYLFQKPATGAATRVSALQTPISPTNLLVNSLSPKRILGIFKPTQTPNLDRGGFKNRRYIQNNGNAHIHIICSITLLAHVGDISSYSKNAVHVTCLRAVHGRLHQNTLAADLHCNSNGQTDPWRWFFL